MSKETNGKTILVATVLSVVCSIALAAAVTLLKPIQEKNQELEKQRKILAAAGVLEEGKGTPDEVNQAFKEFERYVVDFGDGSYRKISLEDPFDMRKMSKDPAHSIALTGSQDLAKIRRRSNEVDIYVLRDKNTQEVKELVLPISGYGLWSTLYGYLVVKADGNTVVGITFTEHAETPGLGGEVDNPSWKAQWAGKTIYDDQNVSKLRLKKGGVDPNKPEAVHEVDALSGATLTSNGVSNLVHFWTGDLGYQKFLAKVRAGGL
ncbi:Na(+)-translocating NADH-quinone reductase subunit C [gamma proteobacterium HdN1]|nr:Na(+)-translocating NADH-quinone reductase subunit C [gamma proteobacterium HdN1]